MLLKTSASRYKPNPLPGGCAGPEGSRPSPDIIAEFKRRLAETLVRSGLDTTDEISILESFLTDLGWSSEATAEGLRRRWRRFLAETPGPRRYLKIDLVFPFCAEKCLYCSLGTMVPSGPDQLQRYAEDLEAEIDYFAPVFSGAEFQVLKAGRGTPSLLSKDQLRRLFGRLMSSFRFAPSAMRCVECNPASVDPGKLGALKEAGFTHVSFGVESHDPTVLASVRRGDQTEGMVQNAVRWSREAGFSHVNLDLIFGLKGDSVAGFLESFRKTADLGPDGITVCCLTLMDAYMKVLAVGRQEQLRRMEAETPLAIEGVARLGRERGYAADALSLTDGIWHWTKGEIAVDVERNPGRPVSILGLGARARSHIFGRSLYARLPRSFGPGKPIYRHSPLKPREEMACHILEALNRSSRVDFQEFERLFGKDVRREFELELRILTAMDELRWDANAFSLPATHPPKRIFAAAVFLLDVLAKSRHSRGRLDRAFRKRLESELPFAGA